MNGLLPDGKWAVRLKIKGPESRRRRKLEDGEHGRWRGKEGRGEGRRGEVCIALHCTAYHERVESCALQTYSTGILRRWISESWHGMRSVQYSRRLDLKYNMNLST